MDSFHLNDLLYRPNQNVQNVWKTFKKQKSLSKFNDRFRSLSKAVNTVINAKQFIYYKTDCYKTYKYIKIAKDLVQPQKVVI